MFQIRLKLSRYFTASFNYTYFKNFINIKLHCLKKLFYFILRRQNKMILITFGYLYCKQSSAKRTKYLIQFTSHEP